MPATERLESECLFHDQQARQRSHTFRLHPDRLLVPDDTYLDHESWIRPAFERLGPLRGKHVLDYGCGHGMASIVMARRGAIVTAFDLSADYLHEAELRARTNAVSIGFVKADAHCLPFADAVFDAIWGNAILHHLNLANAGPEIRRVLRPGGIAVFCEPWGGNPVLSWARRRLAYSEKNRTPDEEPLRPPDLRRLAEIFPNLAWEGFQLTSMIRRALGVPPLIRALDRWDRALLQTMPAAKKWCRYVVLTLPR
jgi:SAM-dependent methyltransferase